MNEPSSQSRRDVLKRAGRFALTGGVLAAGGWAVLNRDRNLVHVRLERTLMQTSVAVNVLADDERHAHHAIETAFQRMAATAGVLTRFDPSSPVARLNREGQLAGPPPALRDVLQRALTMSSHTEGDFDVTVLPVLQYYLRQPRPFALTRSDREIVNGKERTVGYHHVQIDGQGVRFLRPSMAITLDGIAKGYVIDQGITALRQAGVEYALIDAGGEIRTIAGKHPARSWNVGIVDPQHTKRIAAVVKLRNAALSTSGNYEVFFSANRRLFHIINPHTGFSPDHYSSVTVMANEAVDSDAASVAAFSMRLPRIKEFMGGRGYQWLVFSWDGSKRWRSRDLPLVSGQAEIM